MLINYKMNYYYTRNKLVPIDFDILTENNENITLIRDQDSYNILKKQLNIQEMTVQSNEMSVEIDSEKSIVNIIGHCSNLKDLANSDSRLIINETEYPLHTLTENFCFSLIVCQSKITFQLIDNSNTLDIKAYIIS